MFLTVDNSLLYTLDKVKIIYISWVSDYEKYNILLNKVKVNIKISNLGK